VLTGLKLHSSSNEKAPEKDSSVLACYTILTGKQLPVFRRINVLFSSFMFRQIKALQFFQMFVYVYQSNMV
jgi:hypothetical protein